MRLTKLIAVLVLLSGSDSNDQSLFLGSERFVDSNLGKVDKS